MRDTFRFSLTIDDYIKYYQLQYKRTNLVSSIILLFMFAIFALYYCFVLKNIFVTAGITVAVCLSALFMLYMYKVGMKKKAVRQTMNNPAYFAQGEITITDNAIETNNLPNENEAGIIAIYPYSIMSVIYENDEYFIFVIGIEAKILPKRAIPEEMRASVFSCIKKSPKCIFIK